MAFFSIFQLFSLIIVFLFFAGIFNNLRSDRENLCEMTYMFEYPQFVRIKVPDNGLFPQYGLYAYSEGRFTERARKMRFNGIPVLFLPGNIGSHKQVRSIASVALRKALESSNYDFHFDYFSADFNDERSGLFGGVLDRQKEFATHCVDAILNLYSANSRFQVPSSVILIGHSMGGVIARSLLINSRNWNKINLILTLATPHKYPVLNSDYYFDTFYRKIEEYWNMKNLNISNITPNSWNKKVLISVGGGVRDLLVPSDLTYSVHSDINALTTSIPGVWLSTDHLCIVWCKQLVLVINRFLFSVIDPITRQLTDDTIQIQKMGQYYFSIGENLNKTYYKDAVNFIPDSHWHEDSRRTYFMVHDTGITKTWYYMVRLIDAPYHEKVTFDVTDIVDKDWIFGCQAKYVHGQYRICLNGRHLSRYSRWIPTKVGRRRTATLNLKALKASYPQWTHVILRVSPVTKPVKVSVDIHNQVSRTVQAKLPSVYNFGRQMIIKETFKNALIYNITLPGFDMLYQAFVLFVEPVVCEGTKTYHANAKMVVPWGKGQEIHATFSETTNSPLRLRLFTGNPNLKNSSQHVHVVLNLDPQCTFSVSISSSFYDTLGQLSRHYSTSLPAYLAAVSLLVLRHWAASMEPSAPPNMGTSFHSALCGDHTKPYYLLLSARMATMLFVSIPFLAKIAPDLSIGVSLSQNFLLLPLVLYVVALGLMHLLGAAVWCLLIFSGQIAHKLIFRLITVGRGGGIKLWDWAANALRKAPGAGGSLLVAMATGSCGAVALVAGAGFYFFLLTKMYEDYLEHFVYKTIKKVAKKLAVKNPREKSKKKKAKEGKLQTSAKEQAISENIEETEKQSIEETEKQSIESIKSQNIVEELKNNGENSSLEAQNDEKMIFNGIEALNKSDGSGDTVSQQNDVDKLANSTPTNECAQTQDSTVNEADPPMPNEHDEEEEFPLESLHFHFAMFFLWCLITLLNVPALLTWAHNYKYNKVLNPDPSYIPGIIMCSSAAILWQIDAPKKDLQYYGVLKRVLYISSVFILIATPMALYRLNYLLPFIFALITLHQIYPSSTVRNSSNNDDDDDKSPSNIKMIKSLSKEGKNSQDISKVLTEELEDIEKIKLMQEKLEGTEQD